MFHPLTLKVIAQMLTFRHEGKTGVTLVQLLLLVSPTTCQEMGQMSKIELCVLHSGVMDSSTGHDGLTIMWVVFFGRFTRDNIRKTSVSADMT